MGNEAVFANVAAWRDARRVLAIRLDNLGDVLMTTPALAAVKETLPTASVTLLASPSGAALAPHLPFIDDAIAVRVPWVKHADNAATVEVARLVHDIAAREFDAAIIFGTYTQSALPAALVTTMAGIPLRLAHVRENPYQLLTNWIRDPEPGIARHEVERQLALVRSVGMTTTDDRLRMTLRRGDLDSARRRLSEAGIDSRPFVVVHAGATAPSRRYPADRFGAALAALTRSVALQVVFTGTADEADLIDTARKYLGSDIVSASLAGQLSLGELGAVISDASLLISNNTGPVHIAAAVRTPVVDLYALTNPQHTPWRVPSRVLNREVPCRNCLSSICPQGHHLCLNGVAASEVTTAALDLLHHLNVPKALRAA